MTDRKHEQESIDRIAKNIQQQAIDDATAQRIIDRVGERIGIGRDGQRSLSSCADFQAEISAYIDGTLPEARALLIGDHTRECVPCRRVLMQARGTKAPVAPRRSGRQRSRWLTPALRVAAAVIVLVGGIRAIGLVGDVIADRRLRASVKVVDGSLHLVDERTSLHLVPASEIRSRQVLRTGKGSGAVLLLDDGSEVEMNQRSELRLRASRRGTTIDLARGNIIVGAADQGVGRLFVTTDDCEVVVRGTIFAVNHGLKGSRISVIEGEVEVHEGSSSALLRPGDQVTTGDRLRRVPLEQEIAWSRDAAHHKALLRELTELRRVIAEAIDHAPPRTSTFLLDLAPADTLVYAAMPNITADLDEARAALYERMASSEVLAEWWRDHVAAHGVDEEIDRLLDRLQPIGKALGAEAVVTVPTSVIHQQGAPLFMAELEDPSSFGELLQALIDDANSEVEDRAAAVLVDDPRTTSPGDAEVFFWIEGDLFAAAHSIDVLERLAHRVDDPSARSFVSSPLHKQLTETYAAGVSWLFGADLAAATAEGTSQIADEEAAIMDRLGLLDATTLVIERHRDGEWYATNAEIRFENPRHGMMAWLAEPAPMGSLEFVSPDAYVAASAVTKNAEEMFDDLLDVLAISDSGALEELQRVQDQIALDLREDLAAAFGGEGTIALDGPMLPVPSWKLIIEVYDPPTLFHTLERAVEHVNLALVAQDETPLVLESAEASGRTYYTLGREDHERHMVFTAEDGFLLFAPNRALIEQSIDYRDAGVTLANSSAFQALLPDNGYTDCSALVYRDLGSLIDAVPPEILGELEFADALSHDLSRGLVCVFGEPGRITASATGGSLVGLATTFGICGAGHAEKNLQEGSGVTGAVSSL